MPDLDSNTIATQLRDAHATTMALIADLGPQQLLGPQLPTLNPPLWEIGHAAYFYEYWVLRDHLAHAPLLTQADRLYDSIAIAHAERWDLPLPDLERTLSYIRDVEANVVEVLTQGPDERLDYLAQYAVFHHDMHNEAYACTRQTLAYSAPCFGGSDCRPVGGDLEGDVEIPGGNFALGAHPDDGFVFDNEKWGHPLEVTGFQIARAAVSQAAYCRFVEADGYLTPSYWEPAGWDWLQRSGLRHPVYWRRDSSGWQVRSFDHWQPLRPNAAMINVCWHEAQAYCRWAERRLPTELEWEVAAAGEQSTDGRSLASHKRRFPWGDIEPSAEHANLDGRALGSLDVGAYSAGDSAFGCRQMIGNVWEWTQDNFAPYPGFAPDMYQAYSQPLFGITKVLRGGSWMTRGRMIRNTWRTYYGPERNDVMAGFRTCALV